MNQAILRVGFERGSACWSMGMSRSLSWCGSRSGSGVWSKNWSGFWSTGFHWRGTLRSRASLSGSRSGSWCGSRSWSGRINE